MCFCLNTRDAWHTRAEALTRRRAPPGATVAKEAARLAVAYNNGREMPLSKGDAAPDFKIQSIDGKELTMESLKGKKVFLTFFRYAACPLCNLRAAEIKQRYGGDPRVEVVMVFESTESQMKSYAGHLASGGGTVYFDATSAAYSAYQATKSCCGSGFGVGPCYQMCCAKCRPLAAACGICPGGSLARGQGKCGPCCGFVNCALFQHLNCGCCPGGTQFRMPADFLINEDGSVRVVVVSAAPPPLSHSPPRALRQELGGRAHAYSKSSPWCPSQMQIAVAMYGKTLGSHLDFGEVDGWLTGAAPALDMSR